MKSTVRVSSWVSEFMSGVGEKKLNKALWALITSQPNEQTQAFTQLESDTSLMSERNMSLVWLNSAVKGQDRKVNLEQRVNLHQGHRP